MTIAQLSHMRPCEDRFDEVVSLHESAEAYAAAADASAPWLERLMPLLVEGQGPTFYGEVLVQQGSAGGTDIEFPAALRIGERS